jgi:putative endonuclease
MGAFVYILRCSDRSYYVGTASGNDLTKRIFEHKTGSYPGYTWSRRPVELVWSEHFERITDAIAVERKIKGWSRAKKEALIESDWPSVQSLARRRAGRPKVKEHLR